MSSRIDENERGKGKQTSQINIHDHMGTTEEMKLPTSCTVETLISQNGR